MQVCCKRNPKFKAKKKAKTKFTPRRHGDLNIIYDVLQAYTSNYMAQASYYISSINITLRDSYIHKGLGLYVLNRLL